ARRARDDGRRGAHADAGARRGDERRRALDGPRRRRLARARQAGGLRRARRESPRRHREHPADRLGVDGGRAGRLRNGALMAPGGRGNAPNGGRPRANADEWRLDPSDVRRHAQRLRERERKGVLAKGMPYALAALGIAVAFGVYWNFETLRGMRVTFAPLRDLARGTAATADGGRRAGENA